MNLHIFSEFMEKKFKELQKTRDAGQKEYARDSNNVFANFERVALNLDVKREKVLMTYLLKHVDGILAHVNGHISQREDVTGRITDAIVYLFLLWGMVKEDCYNNYEEDEEPEVEILKDLWKDRIGDKPSER